MDKNYRNNKYIIKTGYTGNWGFDWTKSIVAIMFIMLFILTYFFRIVNVDGDSMKNTLINDEKLIVTSFMYTPTDGDIVVISHGQHLDEPIIKRVIATEGETLKIDFDKQKVYVNDKLIDEPYVSSEIVRGDSVIPEIIPEGKIFVMGDNRAISNDSRYNQVGLIDVKDVIGKAQFRILPVDKIGYLY